MITLEFASRQASDFRSKIESKTKGAQWERLASKSHDDKNALGTNGFSKRRESMGLALALIVMGILTLMEQMGKKYGFREGWPWVIVALGIGRLSRNSRSIPGWITTILGILILGGKYYTLNIRFPGMLKLYFLPVLLLVLGFIWLWLYRKD